VNLPTLQYLDAKGRVRGPSPSGSRRGVRRESVAACLQSPGLGITDDAQSVVTLKMTTPVTFVLGPPTSLHAKFVAVASVIAHSTLVPGDVVDVTVPDELAVTPPPA
jgi:hypothetical protein